VLGFPLLLVPPFFMISLLQLLGSLTALLVLLWQVPFILNWKVTRTIMDKDTSLLQLAKAFAKKIEEERPLIAKRINVPETVRNVSPSWLHLRADLSPNLVARN